MSDAPPPAILIVDDDEDCHEIYGMQLEANGFSVLCARDGEQAVELASVLLPAAIIMDVGMPLLDGMEATKQIRANPRTAGIPIIVLSAHAGADVAELAMVAGADAFLTKPCLPTALLAAVTQVVQATASPDAQA